MNATPCTLIVIISTFMFGQFAPNRLVRKVSIPTGDRLYSLWRETDCKVCKRRRTAEFTKGNTVCKGRLTSEFAKGDRLLSLQRETDFWVCKGGLASEFAKGDRLLSLQRETDFWVCKKMETDCWECKGRHCQGVCKRRQTAEFAKWDRLQGESACWVCERRQTVCKGRQTVQFAKGDRLLRL